MERRNKVLIVDSDEQVLIALERLLEEQGIETATTWSARDGLDMLRSRGFDVLLIGDHLSDLSCEQVLREIQRQGVTASILVMETRDAHLPSSASYFAALGANGAVRKRDYGQLLQRINAIPASGAVKRARAA